MVALLVENRVPSRAAGPFRPEDEISSSASEKPSRQFGCSVSGGRRHIGYTRLYAGCSEDDQRIRIGCGIDTASALTHWFRSRRTLCRIVSGTMGDRASA